MNRYNGYNAKVDYFEQSYKKLLNILPTWLYSKIQLEQLSMFLQYFKEDRLKGWMLHEFDE